MTDCLCGCGEQVGRGSSYRPGHDARHAAAVGRALVAAGGVDPAVLSALPTDALRAKALGMLDRAGGGVLPPARTAGTADALVPGREPDPVPPHGVELDGLSTRQLLRLYADLLTELVGRGVVRSRNAPVGDLAEYLVHRAYGGEMGAPSEKSWDVRAADGRLLQVKARLIADGDRKSHNYSPFRSWAFDACVFLILDAHTYNVVRAVEVPMGAVRDLARETAHVAGFRIGTRTPLAGLPGAVDVTDWIAGALRELEAEAR